MTGVLVKLGIIAAVLAALVWAKGTYDERLREEGRAEVQSKWDASAARVAKLVAAQRADSARRAGELQAQLVQLQKEADDAEEYAKALRAQLAVAAGEMGALRGRLVLAERYRKLWNDAARGPGAAGAAGGVPSPADGAPGQDAGAPPAQGGVAASGVDGVDAYLVGVANTAEGRENGAKLMRCQRYAIALWQHATHKVYDVAKDAPWLLPQE